MPIPLGIFAVAGAGGGATGAYEQITTTILGSDQASVVFSSIPQIYKHLQIRAVARLTASSTFETIHLRFNGDTANNYAWHSMDGDGGGSVSASNSVSTSSMAAGIVTASFARANAFGASVIDVLDYASTSKNTTIRSLSGFIEDADPRRRSALQSGFQNNTNAISSITILPRPGVTSNLQSGCTFTLYGIRG